MIGNIMLWAAVSGAALFLAVLGFVVVEEGVRERRAASNRPAERDRSLRHAAPDALEPIRKLAA